MIRRIACVSMLMLVVGLVAATARDVPMDTTAIHYTATMYYGALTPPENQAPGIGMSDFLYRGTAHAELELVGNSLYVTGAYSRLTGPILADVANGIHIHHDPALYHLDTIVTGIVNAGEDAGTFEDTVELTTEQLQMLVEGRLYMDIHTAAFPQGEVRGMIVAVENAQASPELAMQ